MTTCLDEGVGMDSVKRTDPEVYEAICRELKRQHENLELIASENFTSTAVLEAQGSVLTNKYAEGYPGKRWYGGCEHVDVIERLAIERVKQLFGGEHANVQPHSGTSANMAIFCAVLKPGDTILGLNLSHGGHLSHGHPMNFSGKYFNIVQYGVQKDTERLDYDEIEKLAIESKPQLFLVGASAYPRQFDFKRCREIADKVGAYLLVDMAHFAGLVAAGLHPNPVPYSDFVTSTTHKTLRGPRSGVIICREKYAKDIDKTVFPGIQGGPLMHVVAAKAIAFKEALQPEFKVYQQHVLDNARALAKGMADRGYRIVSGGTDNHLCLVDVTSKGLTGKICSDTLDAVRITVNKNTIPFDQNSPFVTSGIRLGSPSVTTRGMGTKEMEKITELIDLALMNREDEAKKAMVRDEVAKLTEKFPLYAELRKSI